MAAISDQVREAQAPLSFQTHWDSHRVETLRQESDLGKDRRNIVTFPPRSPGDKLPGGGEDDNDSGESPLNNKGCTQLIVVVSAKLKNMLVKLDHFPQGSEWKSLKPPATVKQGSVLLNDSNETTQSSRKGCENCANFTTKNRPGWVWSLIPSWRV